MPNKIIDQERAAFVAARDVLNKVSLPAWPRDNKDLDLIQLEVDWVRFSTLNHRTKAEQLRAVAVAENPDLFTADPLGPEAQEAQYLILQTQDGFSDLKADLRERGQQDPAIVTADGILINGNRRTAALRNLFVEDDVPSARYVKCLVLPADATSAELVDLETELQIARDFKQDYAWINEALLIEELYERENRDFGRVATRMHRDIADVRSLYDKLQHVHQIVALSQGAKLHIDFNENESAFDELAKHVKNKPAPEAEAVRSVYFLGTLANVNYRKLRHLRRPDAAALVRRELEADPSLSVIMSGLESETVPTEVDVLDDVLGDDLKPGPLNSVLSFLAQRRLDESVSVSETEAVIAKELLETVQSAVTAAAEEAEEDQRDQTALTAPLVRMDKAIAEIERALAALPRARAFNEFDEPELRAKVAQISEMIAAFEGSD